MQVCEGLGLPYSALFWLDPEWCLQSQLTPWGNAAWGLLTESRQGSVQLIAVVFISNLLNKNRMKNPQPFPTKFLLVESPSPKSVPYLKSSCSSTQKFLFLASEPFVVIGLSPFPVLSLCFLELLLPAVASANGRYCNLPLSPISCSSFYEDQPIKWQVFSPGAAGGDNQPASSLWS